MIDEVIQVNILALESMQRVTLDSLGLAIYTLRIVEAGPLGRIQQTSSCLALPELKLFRHNALMKLAIIIELCSPVRNTLVDLTKRAGDIPAARASSLGSSLPTTAEAAVSTAPAMVL
jgi:hypothetical protein